ncbi:MAG: hypothetical protein IIX15_04830 [Clostridia bacterium]|nr:hypothetical protein [Clostridia bacterium]
MKGQQLKQCFDRVRPREELVEATLARVHALQMKKQQERDRRVSFDWGFATRLASAACAFLLVLGVGVGIGRTIGLPHTADPREADEPAPMDVVQEQTYGVVSPDVPHDVASMSERAAHMADDWAVLDAVIDMAAGDGSVILHVSAVCDSSNDGIVIDSTADGQPTLLAYFDAGNEQMQSLFDAVGSSVLVGLHTEQREGSPIWVVHEFHCVNAE